jgi:hypothetical protein
MTKIDMNLNWVIQHKDGAVTAKKGKDGSLNPYHTREAYTKRDSAETIGLQDDKGNTVVLVNVPSGAEVFQRHRQVPINFYNRFHDMTQTIPGHVNESTGRYVPEEKKTKTYPEITFDECWLIGYRTRKGADVTVYFKVLYPDGTIEEYDAWNVKPWLFPVELFAEELVDAADKDAEVTRLKTEYKVDEVAVAAKGKAVKGVQTQADPKKTALLTAQKQHVAGIEEAYNKRFS